MQTRSISFLVGVGLFFSPFLSFSAFALPTGEGLSPLSMTSSRIEMPSFHEEKNLMDSQIEGDATQYFSFAPTRGLDELPNDLKEICASYFEADQIEYFVENKEISDKIANRVLNRGYFISMIFLLSADVTYIPAELVKKTGFAPFSILTWRKLCHLVEKYKKCIYKECMSRSCIYRGCIIEKDASSDLLSPDLTRLVSYHQIEFPWKPKSKCAQCCSGSGSGSGTGVCGLFLGIGFPITATCCIPCIGLCFLNLSECWEPSPHNSGSKEEVAALTACEFLFQIKNENEDRTLTQDELALLSQDLYEIGGWYPHESIYSGLAFSLKDVFSYFFVEEAIATKRKKLDGPPRYCH